MAPKFLWNTLCFLCSLNYFVLDVYEQVWLFFFPVHQPFWLLSSPLHSYSHIQILSSHKVLHSVLFWFQFNLILAHFSIHLDIPVSVSNKCLSAFTLTHRVLKISTLLIANTALLTSYLLQGSPLLNCHLRLLAPLDYIQHLESRSIPEVNLTHIIWK